MDTLPIFVQLRGRPALVVGGTPVAAARARLLAGAGAEVRVIAPRGAPAWPADLDLPIAQRPFVGEELRGAALVFAATGDGALDKEVAAAARLLGIPVNAADDAEASTFTLGAMIDRDPVVVSITSHGASPALATALRARLEALLPSSLGALAEAAAGMRGAVSRLIPDAAGRRAFWRSLFNDETLDAVLADPPEALTARILRTLAHGRGDAPGRVLLVGAGPGDGDLLTLRALRALKAADVLVYDRLVGEDVLAHARREAERIYVGKTGFGPSTSQGEIEAILIDRARRGQTVVRLKGGDPLIFGRAGEELRALREAGIPVEIVPGITAALASAASAQIPLTERGLSSALTLVSGVRAGGARQDWRGLAGEGRTLAIYMGITTADDTARALIEDGFPEDTPVAVVERAGRPGERQRFGALGGLGALVRDARIQSPALVLVGQVTALAASAPTDGAGMREAV